MILFRLFVLLFVLCLSVAGFAISERRGSKSLYWNQERGYSPFRHATPFGVAIVNASDTVIADSVEFGLPLDDFSITFTVRDGGGRNALSLLSDKNPSWGFSLGDGSGEKIRFAVERRETCELLSTKPELKLSVLHSDGVVSEKVVSEGMDCSGGRNIWKVTVQNGVVSVFGGNKGLHMLAEVPEQGDFTSFGLIASPGASICMSDIILAYGNPFDDSEFPVYDGKDLEGNLASPTDSLEGEWGIFDFSLEDDLMRLGGSYRLLIIKRAGYYDIVYYGGAKVNSRKWLPGMVKGRMFPGGFDGIFNVRWRDAEGNILSNGIVAQQQEENVIQIQFPSQSSVLRLKKINR